MMSSCEYFISVACVKDSKVVTMFMGLVLILNFDYAVCKSCFIASGAQLSNRIP